MQGNLIVSGLTITAGDTQILSSWDHKFTAGTVTLVIGSSGAGKTVLLEMLSGLRKPSAGHIQVGKEPLWFNRYTGKKLNRRAMLLLGTAFQHPEQQLFARSVREEFLYTLDPYRLSKDERIRRIEAVLAHTQSESEPWIARDPYTMSGGEKRRLIFALLQAAEPEWLLLDEPTAGMDQAGISLLCEQLEDWKLRGKGAIVATHDPDKLLPVSDRVLILHEGQMFWDGTPAELANHPYVLEDAGLALSDRLETLRILRRSGFKIPAGWVDPRAAAEAIARGLTADSTAGGSFDGIDHDLEAINALPSTPLLTGKLPSPLAPTIRIPRFINRDPLAVWLSYLLISTGILLQSHWTGWFAGIIVTIGVIGYSGVPFRDWSKPAMGFFLFMLITSVISGLTIDVSKNMLKDTAITEVGGYISGIGFAISPAAETFFRYGRLILVMLSGYVLLSGISHLRLKRALEQRLSGLRHLRFPIHQFAMVASLMVRFLPAVVDEWHRFARISAARGKYPVRPGRLPIRRIYRTAVPFLLSLLRLGELWSLVLMARGVGREGWKPTNAVRMALSRNDVYLIAAASGILLALLLISRL